MELVTSYSAYRQTTLSEGHLALSGSEGYLSLKRGVGAILF